MDNYLFFVGFNYFAPGIISTFRADMMRLDQFLTIGTSGEIYGF